MVEASHISEAKTILKVCEQQVILDAFDKKSSDEQNKFAT
jgi:hypothetical protein